MGNRCSGLTAGSDLILLDFVSSPVLGMARFFEGVGHLTIQRILCLKHLGLKVSPLLEPVG